MKLWTSSGESGEIRTKLSDQTSIPGSGMTPIAFPSPGAYNIPGSKPRNVYINWKAEVLNKKIAVTSTKTQFLNMLRSDSARVAHVNSSLL